MNIAVIGATGMVGERTVTEAIARGHQVEGYSRSGQAVAGAEGKAVDLSNTGELVTIINSHDVTIIAVSAGRGEPVEVLTPPRRKPLVTTRRVTRGFLRPIWFLLVVNLS